MTDLKIPNLNKSSNKYLFKNKLSLKRKPKGKLILESFIMLFLSTLIIFFNSLIPNKKLIFNNLLKNFNKLNENFIDSIFYIYQICLSIFIVISLILALILLIGSFSRMIKIFKRKNSRIQFK